VGVVVAVSAEVTRSSEGTEVTRSSEGTSIVAIKQIRFEVG
jgi:hypothetical protein